MWLFLRKKTRFISTPSLDGSGYSIDSDIIYCQSFIDMATRIVEGAYCIIEQFENRFAVVPPLARILEIGTKSETVSYYGCVTTNNDFQ